jgi:hypothetical protein
MACTACAVQVSNEFADTLRVVHKYPSKISNQSECLPLTQCSHPHCIQCAMHILTALHCVCGAGEFYAGNEQRLTHVPSLSLPLQQCPPSPSHCNSALPLSPTLFGARSDTSMPSFSLPRHAVLSAH